MLLFAQLMCNIVVEAMVCHFCFGNITHLELLQSSFLIFLVVVSIYKSVPVSAICKVLHVVRYLLDNQNVNSIAIQYY